LCTRRALAGRIAPISCLRRSQGRHVDPGAGPLGGSRGGVGGQGVEQRGHLLERLLVRRDVVHARQFARVPVADDNVVALAPDKDAQRQFDPDPAVVLHQWRAALRIAEQHDLLVFEAQAGVARAGRVVDSSEQRQASTLDRADQGAHRFRETRSALTCDHKRVEGGSPRSRVARSLRVASVCTKETTPMTAP
jgi:hypothetical protein